MSSTTRTTSWARSGSSFERKARRRSTLDSGVSIRRFSAEEWPFYRELRLAALADSPDAFGSTLEREAAQTDAAWSSRLAQGVASATDLPLVAETAGRRVGLAWGRIEPSVPETAHLFQMWVAPAHRGIGAGRLLVEAVIRWACRMDVRNLLLGVTCGDTPAVRLYTRAGFVPDGEPEPIRPGASVLAWPMRLVLDGRVRRALTEGREGSDGIGR